MRNYLGARRQRERGCAVESLEARALLSATVDGLSAVDDAYSTNEDWVPFNPGTSALFQNDVAPPGGNLTAELVSGPSHGTLTLQADGTFEYVTAPNFNGTDSFVYRAVDPVSGAGAEATVTLTIRPVNDPPIFDRRGEAHIDGPFHDQCPAFDVDGDPLVFSIKTPPQYGTVELEPDGSFTYTPDPVNRGIMGYDYFWYSVTDGQYPRDGTYQFWVAEPPPPPPLPVNHPPTFTGGVADARIDGPFRGQFPMTDPDGDALTFSITTPPQYGTVTLEPDGWFTYTPDPVARGIGGGYDYFWYSATDGQTPFAGLWQFWVADPPPAPPAPPVMVIVGYQDSPLYGELDFLDADADDLSVSLAARAAHGKVSVFADGSFRYRPRRGYVGDDSFVVRSNDGTGWVESTVGLMVKAGLKWAAPNREFAFYESQEVYHQSDYFKHALYEGDYTPQITFAGVMIVLSDDATADDLSAPVLPADLVVMGTRDADSIRVSRASRGRVRVWLNDVPLGTFAVSGDVRVYALTGDDRVQLSGGQFGTEVYGGRGNDALTGSTAADSLFGDDGDDTIYGRGGSDLLVGGLGADLVSGDAGGDLLIDSLVPFDLISEDLHGGEQGVFLLAAWNEPGTIEEKLAALSADTGPLSAAKRALMYDEGDVDVLVGGADLDCVLASALTDTFRDRATGDVFAPFATGPAPAP